MNVLIRCVRSKTLLSKVAMSAGSSTGDISSRGAHAIVGKWALVSSSRHIVCIHCVESTDRREWRIQTLLDLNMPISQSN